MLLRSGLRLAIRLSPKVLMSAESEGASRPLAGAFCRVEALGGGEGEQRNTRFLADGTFCKHILVFVVCR